MNKNKKYRYRLGSLLHCLSVSIEEIQRHCLIQMPNKIWDDTLGILRGASNQKTKNIYLLKFHFRRGMFYKELPNSQKNSPRGPHPRNPEIGPQARYQNPLCHSCLARTAQGKGLGADRAYPGLTRQEYYPPKSYCRPEISSKSIHLFKSYSLFTVGGMDRWTDTQTPYKMNHPLPYTGVGWNFLPYFFYLSQNGVSK